MDSSPILHVHQLVNRHGDSVELLDLGARIRALTLQLPSGPRNVVLGYERLDAYLSDRYFVGATIGRCCNRIGGARFAIDGAEYRLVANEGPNHLHGGPLGFHKRHWHVQAGADERAVTFRLESKAGDQGYPGNVTVRGTYEWSDDRELTIRYRAVADAPTHVNLTNHAYFNLDGGATVLDHTVQIASRAVTATGDDLIPTGSTENVIGTVLDLRQPTRVADLVSSEDPRVVRSRGVDLNYVLAEPERAAVLTSGNGDLRMEVATSYPGLQLYTGQHLSAPFQSHAGLCLEAQYFPDAPNRPHFPSTLLKPGRAYEETIRYRFVT